MEKKTELTIKAMKEIVNGNIGGARKIMDTKVRIDELIEKCKKEELNEKEKFYIELYQSYEYGFNSNSDIKTKVDLFKNL